MTLQKQVLTTTDIRAIFVEYFAQRGHAHVASSPLVPQNDPTLLFVNAGMVPFKDVFTGRESRDYVRAVSSQKCVRAGGKHNDLDQVGYTARHHTFFEMLGNFSFGDYFKDQAIEYAWDFITRELGVNKGRLLVTVYADDTESAQLWKKIAGLSERRIIPISSSDNFWSMGDTGPCGPCTEIFYDHGDHIPGGVPGSPEQDGDRFVEIWNLVFMQYEQLKSGKRTKLPNPCVDTGMSLERLTAVMQGVSDNYDIDLFREIIRHGADLADVNPQGDKKVSLRVIADHLRTSCFLMADGVLPSNEGRGYVLRRIMRRAMRHAHSLMPEDLMMYKLVGNLVGLMGGVYPELNRAQPLIEQTLKMEEERFRSTLDKGLRLLGEETEKLQAGDILPGDVAFKLYDTFGFPLDLTEDILKKSSISVDLDGFDASMKQQKEKARASWKGSGGAAEDLVWFDIKDAQGVPDFTGYEALASDAVISSLVFGDRQVDKLSADQEGWVITNQTPFYGESGGQVGDKGWILADGGIKAKVIDTKKFVGDLIVHKVKVEVGCLKKEQVVHLEVDRDRRDNLCANHTTTHLLHEALRMHLGNHVSQKGSLVEPTRLRFDFSHPEALSPGVLADIETEVNRQIQANYRIVTTVMNAKEAVEKGAMALFGEKYGEEVRVVSMGASENDTYSLELCGGTHVKRTGDIGSFKIISDVSAALGVRRIEAVTGLQALKVAQNNASLVQDLGSLLKVGSHEIKGRVHALQEALKEKDKEMQRLQKKALSSDDAPIQQVTIKDIVVLGQHLQGVPAKNLKGYVDELKNKHPKAVIMLTSEVDGKVACVVGVTDTLTIGLDATDIIRKLTPILGGKGGGGRSDMAQGGGSDVSKVQEAFDSLNKILESMFCEATGL